jgi:uncharacterized protein YbcC (UPF0753/DUF2309 family)
MISSQQESVESMSSASGSPLWIAVERACARIAPSWPLDRFIAVNPLWGWVDMRLPEVAARIGSLGGTRMLMPRSFYREAWQRGELRTSDLQEATRRAGAPARVIARVKALLESDEPALSPRARVVDVVDVQRNPAHGLSLRDFIVSSVSDFCGSYFDAGQAQTAAWREGGLYASWRRHAIADRAPSLLLGLQGYTARAQKLPETASAMAELALLELGVSQEEWEPYLTSLLLDQNGWASWCAYRRWTARLEGQDCDDLVELLAIRLAWEWLLFELGPWGTRARWRLGMASWAAADTSARLSQADDWLLQKALEIAWQRRVAEMLQPAFTEVRPAQPAAQVVFCIDVRSEVLRRALEQQSSAVQTLGFAGFFGLPVEYLPTGARSPRPQLPGLLAPRLRVTELGLDEGFAARRASRLTDANAWGGYKTAATSCFSYVEGLGVVSATSLVADAFGWSRPRSHEDAGLSAGERRALKPRLTSERGGEPLSTSTRADLAEQMLRGMSLTRGFARLVLLSGHSSQTRNNAHASGLDCGACCGQSGEVNARVAAALLNEPAVREALAERGIVIPAETRFLAGLHNTTTDEVELLELDAVPRTHVADVAQLRRWLAAAGRATRRERSASLGLGKLDDDALHEALRARARDWAELQPEWGLSNNASFIVAPRERSRHMRLAGRSFLHEYRSDEDDGYARLEQIMTAPMIVAHWINFQYYASTVANSRYGSGNKVLHNVVGGHLGVFEGNGGDLRIGLPLQSVHDGTRWVHTPLRLSVFIEAPREAIEAVLRKHALVRQLVDNEWLDLLQIAPNEGAVFAYQRGAWRELRAESGAAPAAGESEG